MNQLNLFVAMWKVKIAVEQNEQKLLAAVCSIVWGMQDSRGPSPC